ncbi:MAG: hypothetical protein HWD86_10005 [Kangiellaceae bacterium]|nr:hypothetical protein [Kangiellaceae bacterium]
MKYLIMIFSFALAACSSQDAGHKTSEYQSPGKPSAEVAMKYNLTKERVAVGETVTVSVSFDNSAKAIAARFEPTANMVMSGDNIKNFAQAKGDANASYSFEVTPLTEGIHYINVFAKDASVSHEKPFAIRVVAGDKPIEEYLEVNGTLSEDENGEKIIIMKAQENQ